ncbi:putative alpha-ketoglutarate-dependent dioxygenase [Chloropicon primus]|nr:putative alpha-ketoglutarate-dependent dioxygenase [Chloropicon primus]
MEEKPGEKMAAEEWQGTWRRPGKEGDGNGEEATRYLLIGNVGPSSGVSVEALRDHLATMKVEAVVPPRESGKGKRSKRSKGGKAATYVFAAFGSATDAKVAKGKLSGDGIGDVKVMVEYAVYCPPKEKPKVSEEYVRLRAEDLGIDGLYLLKDFVSEEEERGLLSGLDESGEWKCLARRRVKHFGFEFDYSIRGVHPNKEIVAFPPCIEPITDRIAGVKEITNERFDQLTVNEYPMGVGLSPHVDTHSAFAGDILSLSLGSSAVMEFRKGEDHRRLFVPRRSLLAMTGESRLAWQHYIPHRKTDKVGAKVVKRTMRTSITFRTVRKQGGCSCPFPEQCDSQGAALPPTRMLEKSQQQQQAEAESMLEKARKFPEMEKDHVHGVYDCIAGHFSSTRFAIWPEVKRFLDGMPEHSLVGDIGCGNGKYFGAAKHCRVVGGDLSFELVQLCKNRGHEVVQLDVVRPPYRQNLFDGVISIAVLHHMSTFERRLAAMTSIVNLLRPGGLALVTVWAMEQEEVKKMKKWKELSHGDSREGASVPVLGKDYLVPWSVPFHRPEAGEVAKQSGKVDEQKGLVVFERFYHVFERGELEYLVNYIPNVTVMRCVYDRSNWCITVRRDT